MTMITVTAPSIPGSTPVVQASVSSLSKAREVARGYSGRRDLRWQDVRIELAGKLIEYAGPSR